MRRRDFGIASLGVIASTMLADSTESAELMSRSDFPRAPGLTDYVAKFVSHAKYEDIPGEVVELGKKSILDGLGLALAGSNAQTGTLCRRYPENFTTLRCLRERRFNPRG